MNRYISGAEPSIRAYFEPVESTSHLALLKTHFNLCCLHVAFLLGPDVLLSTLFIFVDVQNMNWIQCLFILSVQNVNS